MRLRQILTATIPVVLMASVLTAGAATGKDPGEPNPLVEGPIQGGVHGYMWNHSLFDLQKYDYTENEYFYSGVATVKQNGQAVTAPYRSRFFVRLPRNPKKFNGTIAVEWLNVTDQDELETAYPPGGEYQMSQGLGIVGVSAQLAGICCGPTTLKGWDPVRYASLVHPGDQFSSDIFSQTTRALRGPTHAGVDPTRGLHVRKLIVTGASQSALRLTDFVNGGYNRHQVDLYVITRGGGPFTNFSTPIFQLNEENNDIPQKDGRRFVGWQEAGAAHAPYQWWGYIAREEQRDGTMAPGADPINSACSVNHGSVDYSSRALSGWVTRFLKTGRMPPHAPRVKLDSSGAIARD